MVLPTPVFPFTIWDGNEQDTTYDGAADTQRAQAGDHNEMAAETIAIMNWVGSKVSMRVINKTGGALSAGKHVSITGRDATTGLMTVDYARSASGSNYDPAIGILPAQIDDDDVGEVMLRGMYGPIDTSGKAVNDPLWLDSGAGGGHIWAPPQWPVYAQKLAHVIVVGVSGYIYVDPDPMNGIETIWERWANCLTGSCDQYLIVAPLPMHILQVTLISDTTTVSTAVNHWTFQVANLTAANNLLSAAKDTNGDDITADIPWLFDPDQNTFIDTGDVIEIQATKFAGATNMNEVGIQVDYVLDVPN